MRSETKPSARSVGPAGLALVAVLLGVPAWSAGIPREPGLPDYWNAVAVDSSGSPVVVGVSFTKPYSACDFVAAKLSGETGVVAWRTALADHCSDETYGPSGGERIFLDPLGDVVVGRRSLAGERRYYVSKLSGATGTLRWAQHVGDFPKDNPWVHAIVLGLDGVVFAGGGFGTYGDQTRTDFVVAALEGTSGQAIWRRSHSGTFPGDQEDEAYNQVRAVAAGPTGDVFASGILVASPRDSRWTIMRFAGATGATQWKHVVGQSSASDIGWDGRSFSSLAVDARGDVVGIATTITPTDPPRYRLTVVKLSGAGGTLLWRRSLRYSTGLAVLALTPDGDVVAAGTIQRPRQAGQIVVVGLDGRRGRRRWRRDIAGTMAPGDPLLPFDGPNALVVHPTGNVLLAGQERSPGQGADFVVLALDAATGAERWRRQIDGEAHGDDGARALAIAGSDVIAVGEVKNVATNADAIALALSVASGEERWRLECDASAVTCTPTSAR